MAGTDPTVGVSDVQCCHIIKNVKFLTKNYKTHKETERYGAHTGKKAITRNSLRRPRYYRTRQRLQVSYYYMFKELKHPKTPNNSRMKTMSHQTKSINRGKKYVKDPIEIPDWKSTRTDVLTRSSQEQI